MSHAAPAIWINLRIRRSDDRRLPLHFMRDVFDWHVGLSFAHEQKRTADFHPK
jgi:hypothetical protein